MTNEMRSGDWQRLARKMVYSYTEEESAEMKASVVSRYRTAQKRRKMVAVVGVAMLLGAILGPVLSSRVVSQPSVAVTGAEAPSMGDAIDVRTSVPKMDYSAIDTKKHSSQSDVSPRAIPLIPGTRFSVEEETSASTYRISSGSVRFETEPTVNRKLVVRVGSLMIEDIGTVFTVETLSEDHVRVSVSEGRVKVSWPSGRAELKAGSDGTFPSGAVEENRVISGKSDTREPSQPIEDWRTAARDGRNQLALQLIDAQPKVVQNRVDDLLLAADVMRLTRNPERAASYLSRVVRQFPQSTRRTAAAFTLGKVYLNELGNAGAAASMFAIAAQNSSPLAEEAMAREAEAWYRAGNSKRANRAVQRYLNQFPNGARADSVRAFYDDTP
ncbi:MAG: FecR domain-containing protein [Deltaproteobacteria bacterium]|nr:FecR domain-containing protein [Deltaproteobacteria bacterium]